MIVSLKAVISLNSFSVTGTDKSKATQEFFSPTRPMDKTARSDRSCFGI